MDLLDLAQMENSTFKLNKSFFNIREVIKKAFCVVGHAAELRNVQLVEAEVLNEDA
jgi:signal transduction histidine kinase